jgi:hypothetical protein
MVIIAVMGFWALWDNIINAAMAMLLNLYMLLCGNSALK